MEGDRWDAFKVGGAGVCIFGGRVNGDCLLGERFFCESRLRNAAGELGAVFMSAAPASEEVAGAPSEGGTRVDRFNSHCNVGEGTVMSGGVSCDGSRLRFSVRDVFSVVLEVKSRDLLQKPVRGEMVGNLLSFWTDNVKKSVPLWERRSRDDRSFGRPLWRSPAM